MAHMAHMAWMAFPRPDGNLKATQGFTTGAANFCGTK